MVFHIEAIPAGELDRIRGAGADDYGNPLRPFAADEPGAPLRCCLREAGTGERITLISYRPSGTAGPYAEVGPVFVHAERCAGYEAGGGYPAGFRHRQQVFRAYGHDGAIADAVVVDGAGAEEAIDRFFARPEVAVLHSRNVGYGCYMFAIHRAPAGS